MARRETLKQILGDLSFHNSSPFAKLLESCVQSKSVLDTRRVHARLLKSRFSSEVFIHNRIVDAYWRCGSLSDARKMFDKMPVRNIFSWNSIMAALFKSSLIDEAEKVFKSMVERDQCTWNSMISGFAQHDMFAEALAYFIGMHRQNFLLNEYTFASALSVCAGLHDARIGMQIHALMLKSWDLSHVYMASALVDMYSKCGDVRSAQTIFDGMTERNRISWNSLITCYEQNGPAEEALKVFVVMMNSGIEPDEVTLASVVSACATLSETRIGRQLHTITVKNDNFRDDIILSNAVVDMYAKGNKINEARRVFDRIPIRSVVSETSMISGYAKTSRVKAARHMFSKMMEKNIVSWNALIAGYAQNGENEEALSLFRCLKRESVCPTHYTFGNILNACANLSDLQLGRQAHVHVVKHGFRFEPREESDVFVGNSLIDMYVKCGSVGDGFRVFETMREKDWVSWNAMIVGLAQNGQGGEAINLFRKMLDFGEKPDHVTMIGVLCACSHAGLVDEGRRYFFSMMRDFSISPTRDHYACIVDLLGRAGHLEEAKNLVEEMPMQPDSVIWGSLLASCKVHRNISLGEYAADKLLRIDPSNSGPYVLLSNMYAELGRWGDMLRVRKTMRKQGITKQPGCSWVEIHGRVNVFMVKDKRHPQRKTIYTLLKLLMVQMNDARYVTIMDCNEWEEDDETKTVFRDSMIDV